MKRVKFVPKHLQKEVSFSIIQVARKKHFHLPSTGCYDIISEKSNEQIFWKLWTQKPEAATRDSGTGVFQWILRNF